MFSDNEKNKLKIMLLHMRKRQEVLYLSVKGNLGKKGRRDSSNISSKTKKEIKQSINKFKWKFIPRGQVAVTMTFFPKENQFPAIQNLVKYYLDELCGLVFSDDRQVSYLEVECWNPTNKINDSSSKNNSKVFIKVERLSNYQSNFDLLFEILRTDELRNCLDKNILHSDESLDDFEEKIDYSSYPNNLRNKLYDLNVKERQRKFLSINRITQFDRPGLSKWARLLISKYGSSIEFSPLNIPLGNLPNIGEKKAYKDSIRSSLIKFRNRYETTSQIKIPIELDVKVFCKKSSVSKDLDNIMRDVIPILENEILDSEIYVHGYRIYVADKNISDLETDLLSLRLLPVYSFSEFRRKKDEIFETAERWIEQEIN